MFTLNWAFCCVPAANNRNGNTINDIVSADIRFKKNIETPLKLGARDRFFVQDPKTYCMSDMGSISILDTQAKPSPQNVLDPIKETDTVDLIQLNINPDIERHVYDLGIFAVYVTHSTPTVVKGLAHRFNKDSLHIQAIYKDLGEGGGFSILNSHDVKSALEEKGSINLREYNINHLSVNDFVDLINQIKAPDASILLASDANLGIIAHHCVTKTLHQLVELADPSLLVLYSGEANCVNDAKNYLVYGGVSEEGFKRLSVTTIGIASDKHGVGNRVDMLLKEREGLIMRMMR